MHEAVDSTIMTCGESTLAILIALTIISELALSSFYLELEHSRTFHVRMYCVLLKVVISPY